MNRSITRGLICWLSDAGDGELALVGGKGANLGRLWRLGVPVPPGFVVTTDAYHTFVAANDLTTNSADQLRERILAAPMPTDVRMSILESYQRLGAPAVAVRSSGTAEDLGAASFAGQHDTVLNVVGPEAVLSAVQACWASLWSERAIDYRRQREWDERDLGLAVVVQTMVPAEWAGVLFTADPVTGRRDRLVVEATPGLGETLVSGQVTGNRYVLEKTSLHLLEGDDLLPRATLDILARVGIQIEDAFGSPQDVEWAYADERCYVLQARPLTALPSDVRPLESQKPRSYSRFQRASAPGTLDHLPVPPYPFDYSIFFRPLVERAMAAARSLGFAAPAVDDLFLEVADGVYQIVPPMIRPTPRALVLPLKLVTALRANSDLWLAKCRETLGTLAQRTDREDLSALSEQDLLERIEALRRLQLDLAPGRFVPFPQGMLASQGLTLLLRLAVARRAQDLERELLAGVPCVTTDANHELGRLARLIRDSDEVRRDFLELSPERLPARLGETSAGRTVLAEVEEFLQRYGLRETVMASAALPSWRDDPSIIYGLLKGLVADQTSTSVLDVDDGKRAEDARSTAMDALSRRWLGLGKHVVPLFLRVLAASRAFLAFREDSHYSLLIAFPVIRRLALELGQRMVLRGALDDAADIFFLHVSEVRDPRSPNAIRETARKRKAARRSLQGRLTTVPADLLEQTADTTDVHGVPVSPGQAIGHVRIILSEQDFWKLQKGEVLVARYTNPTWTPLFALAGAVVVDYGGTASHAAIVAREYGIPAVMGTRDATARLRDGQRVLVDGEKGRVVPLDSPEDPSRTGAAG